MTADICGECHYRDHELDASSSRCLPHLLPCSYLGAPLGGGAAPSRFACSHERYETTTEDECRNCPDYLFPLIAPVTPPDAVAGMLDLPLPPQPEGWWNWPNVREAMRLSSAAAIAACPPYPGGYRGRGIVIVGGGRYFASAYVTARVLRHVGCELPIQLWHLAGEITPVMRAALKPFDVTCVDADRVARRHPFRFVEGHWWKGWQLKSYAIAHAPFREVLLLDADCYPTKNPEFLFDWPAYREHGAVFWPDLESSAGLLPNETWHSFGALPGWRPIESGQLLINKKTCWAELNLTLWYNAHAHLVYRILWGDKDTFNIAWRRLGTHYAMTQPRCGWDVHTILQYGPDGEVLFQHRCQDKFRLGHESFDSTYQRAAANQYNPRLVHEDLCFGFLDELRRTWGGPWGMSLHAQ